MKDGDNNCSVSKNNSYHRRDILKAASVSTIGPGIYSAKVSAYSKPSSQTIDINIYQSGKLTYEPWNGGFIKTYAFSESLKEIIQKIMYNCNKNVNITTIDSYLDVTIDDGLTEVRKAIESHDADIANNVNILLGESNVIDGLASRANPGFCYATAKLRNLDTSIRGGEDKPLKMKSDGSSDRTLYRLLATCIHEIGHCLQDDNPRNSCYSDGCLSFDHQLGTAYEEGDEVYISPLRWGVDFQDSNCYSDNMNVCCEDIIKTSEGSALIDLNYSNCFWEHADI